MEKRKVVAYWDIFDSETGSIIEKQKPIVHKVMPSVGGLIIGIPSKLNAIVKDFKFSGTKDGLPRYRIYG